MPYKGKDLTAGERMKRLRDKRKGVTGGVTKEGVTTGSNIKYEVGADIGGKDYSCEMFNGKPRYLTLSDGQVFDRASRPAPNKHIPEMIACNESSYNFKPRKDR